MMHRAWSSIKISKSRGTKKIANFDPKWTFPDCNSSLNSPMDLKWCTKLNVVKNCHVVFRGHPSNCKVTRTEQQTIWNQFEITRPVAAIKFLRFARLCCKIFVYRIHFIHNMSRIVPLMIGLRWFNCLIKTLVTISVLFFRRTLIIFFFRCGLGPFYFWICRHLKLVSIMCPSY